MLQVGALEAAIADFSQAVALNPQHSRAHYHRGITLEGLELLEEAMQVSSMKWTCLRPTYILNAPKTATALMADGIACLVIF